MRVRFVWLGVSMMAAALPARAQVPELSWERVPGPFGGRAVSVVAPAGGGFVSSDGAGLYRSDDGRRWTLVPTPPVTTERLQADPDGTVWSLGRPVLRSADGGRSWSGAGGGLPNQAADDVLGLPDGAALAATETGLYRRPPGTVLWQPTDLHERVYALARLPSGTVLAGVGFTPEGREMRVLRSTDDGSTWAEVRFAPDAEAYVSALTVVGSDVLAGGTMPWGYTTPGAWRSADDGLTWEQVSGLDAKTAVNRLRAVGNIVLARTGFFWTAAYLSTDAGVTWARLDRDVNDLAGTGTGLLVATQGLGLQATSDGAATWADATEGFGRAPVDAVDVRPDGLVLATATGWDSSVGVGLFRSADGGATWVRRDVPGAPTPIFGLTRLADGTLLTAVSIYRCYGSAACPTAGVYRSVDLGDTWQPTPLVSPGFVVRVPAVVEPGGAVWQSFELNTGAGGGIARSEDGGQTWDVRPDLPVGLLAAAPNGTLWGVGGPPSAQRVLRSVDGGATWQPVLDLPDLRPGSVEVTTGGTVLVVLDGRIYRSADGGAAWTSSPVPLRVGWGETRPFAGNASGHLFVGSTAPPFVLRSTDDGLTWEPVSTGLGSVPSANRINLSTAPDGVLWVSLGPGSLYRTTTSTLVSSETVAPPDQPLSVEVGPNPTQGVARVRVTVREPGRPLRVEVFDALGRSVAVLHDGPAAATLDLDVRLPAAGVYAVRAIMPTASAVRRVTSVP